MVNYDYLNSLYKLPRSSDGKVEGVSTFGLPLYIPGRTHWYVFNSGHTRWHKARIHNKVYIHPAVTKPVYGLRGREWTNIPNDEASVSSYENPTANSNWYWDENWSDWYTSGMGMDAPMEILFTEFCGIIRKLVHGMIIADSEFLNAADVIGHGADNARVGRDRACRPGR